MYGLGRKNASMKAKLYTDMIFKKLGIFSSIRLENVMNIPIFFTTNDILY